MEKRNQSMMEAISSFLRDFSVIGTASAVYNLNWPCLIVALIAFLVMLCLAWKSGGGSD